MTYTKLDDKIIIRLARGKNIFTDLYKILTRESVKSAWINGIGAIENVEVGSYDLKNKRYNRIKLEGVYELISLMGNLSYKEGEPFLHLHVNLSDHECKTYGGHLFNADINATGEFIIYILNVHSSRVYNENIGLHLLEFENCEK